MDSDVPMSSCLPSCHAVEISPLNNQITNNQCVQDPLGLIFFNFALQCHLLASYGVKILEFQLWLSVISKRKQRCIMQQYVK
jgi:hypothetical protein